MTLSDEIRSDESFEMWSAFQDAWIGVSLMGGLYGMIMPLIVGSITLLRFSIAPPIEFFVFLIAAVLMVGPVCGLVLAGFWSFVALITVAIINLSFGHILGRRTSLNVFGGMSGYVATFWVLIEPPTLPDALQGVFFVGLAMAMGQYGALRWAAKMRPLKIEVKEDSQPRRFQFQVRHLLVAMIWCSFVLALDQFFPNQVVIFFVGMYLLSQIVFICIDQLIMKLKHSGFQRSLNLKSYFDR